MFLRLPDRWFFGGVLVVAVLMIALAAVWPQGIGARSPGPFGHAVVIPAYVKVDEKKAKARKDILRAAKAAKARASGGIQAPDAVAAEKNR